MASWMLSKKAEARIAEALTYKLASLTPGTDEHSEWAEFVANLRDEMPEAFARCDAPDGPPQDVRAAAAARRHALNAAIQRQGPR